MKMTNLDDVLLLVRGAFPSLRFLDDSWDSFLRLIWLDDFWPLRLGSLLLLL